MFNMLRSRFFISSIFLLAIASIAAGGQTTRPSPSEQMLEKVRVKGPLLLHLPGVGGYLGVDRRMLAGLRDADLVANIVVYDWTEHDPGIHALQAYGRNQREAQIVSDLIAAHASADPQSPIYITAHSGGCAIAAWALAKLPADINVQTVILIAPALSPTFDLSPALRHVEGKMYVFYSRFDTLVLFTGTRIFGTMDGIQTQAAGFSGFVEPKNADPLMYQKLVQRPYEKAWAKYGDYGDHIGGMSRAFASAMIEPLISSAPTTQASVQTDSAHAGG
jgi:pimeloyl-ACP methyl ester carboxylesterase